MTSYRGSHFERKEIIFAVKTNITNQLLEVMLVFTPRHNEPNAQLTEEILWFNLGNDFFSCAYISYFVAFMAAVKCPVLTYKL